MKPPTQRTHEDIVSCAEDLFMYLKMLGWESPDARRVAALEEGIREHRDSFDKDMEEHDWTTEDEALWDLLGEEKK